MEPSEASRRRSSRLTLEWTIVKGKEDDRDGGGVEKTARCRYGMENKGAWGGYSLLISLDLLIHGWVGQQRDRLCGAVEDACNVKMEPLLLHVNTVYCTLIKGI